MTKNYKDFIKEAVEDGAYPNMASPIAIRELNIFAKRMTGAMQPSIEEVITKIEREVNRYGYTLGELESDEFEENGAEGFALFNFNDGEPLKNVVMELEWERTSPEVYDYAPTVLKNLVKLKVHEIDPDDWETFVTTGTMEVPEDDDYVGDPIFGDDDSDDLKEESLTKFQKIKVGDMVIDKETGKKVKVRRHDKNKQAMTVDMPDGTVQSREYDEISLAESELEEEAKETYKEFVKRMMAKHNFDIKSASDEETKAFFNKIDKEWNAEDEKGEDGLEESTTETVEESLIVKKQGEKTITFSDSSKVKMVVTASATGLTIKVGDSVFSLNKSQAPTFVENFVDLVVDNLNIDL